MIWPYSNQNIFSEDVTTEPTRYLWAKRQPLIFKCLKWDLKDSLICLDFFQPKNKTEN